MGRWSRHLELATRGCGECKMLQCYGTSVLQYNCSDVAARYVSELPDEMPALDQRSEIRNHGRIVRLREIWVWISGI